MVSGLRFAVDFLVVDFFAVALPACARRFALAAAGARFFDVVCLPVVAVAPDETRDECLVRWRTAFFGAASAIDAIAKEATIATSNIFIVLRLIGALPGGSCEWSAYDNASAAAWR